MTLSPEPSRAVKTGEPRTEKPRSIKTSSSVTVASPQGKTKVLVSGHHLSARHRRRSVSLVNALVEAITASKIPACIHVGLCREDILMAQDLNFVFGSLHPLKETLKDRDFESGGDGGERF